MAGWEDEPFLAAASTLVLGSFTLDLAEAAPLFTDTAAGVDAGGAGTVAGPTAFKGPVGLDPDVGFVEVP
jgi:hypothetical protein